MPDCARIWISSIHGCTSEETWIRTPRRWWQIIDGALFRYGLRPRADRCTYILYEDRQKSKIPTPQARTAKTGMNTVEQAIEHLPGSVSQNNAQGRKPHGFLCLHVDDLFMGGDNKIRYLPASEGTSTLTSCLSDNEPNGRRMTNMDLIFQPTRSLLLTQ